MILSTPHKTGRYYYLQPDLPWYKRLIGMRYAKGWQVRVDRRDGGSITSEPSELPPNPARVMQAMLKLQDTL